MLTCDRGLADVLAEEARALGVEVVSVEPAAVEVMADEAERMRMCLRLRTAHRVLLPVLELSAGGPKALYHRLSQFPWEDHLGPDGYVRVHGYVKNDRIRDQRFAFLTVKDAVMDRLRDHYGRRPDSGSSDHGAGIHVYWVEDRVRLSLDLSGPPLSRRGYRVAVGEAPLRESLAAALLMRGGWPTDTALVNPMCGSGTLAIEAAWLALNRAPGLTRDNFGLFHLKGFDEALWKREVAAAERVSAESGPVPVLVASDHDPAVLEMARENARRAGVEELIRFEARDFRETTVPEGPSWVVLNPPWGLRLEPEEGDLEPLYRDIGQWLKALDGGRALVLTGNLALAKRFGLKLAEKHTLFNGSVECRLLGFDLFRPGEGA